MNRQPLLTRRRFISTALAAGAGVGAANAFGIQPNRVTITRHRIGPADGRTIRAVQLTDLHLRDVGFHEHRIARAVAELRPDLLLLTGDSIDRRDRLPQLADFLAELPASTHALAILGNWEHWAGVDLRALDTVDGRRGIQLLRNESVALSFPAGQLLVTGLDDLVGGRPDAGVAMRGVVPAVTHLLLAHCPAQRDMIGNLRPNLVLSGHTHGGQVRIAGWAPFVPQGSGRYLSGWYRGGGPDLYVSRGLGTSVVPARIGAPPEIAVFDWSLAPS